MKAILSILVALGLPAAFWNYYLKESPDVKYSISTAIPLAFEMVSGNEHVRSEFVQQIEVANSGKGEAKKIVVKLSRPISQYYLTKHSSTEQAIVSNGKDGFELSYPSLPPSTGFQLTVKLNEDLTDNQVTVFHQAGKAELVSPGARKTEFSLLNIFWLVLYFFITYSSLRDEFKYRYLFRRYSANVDELLRSKKPWYIRQADWPRVRTDLLRLATAAPIPFYSLSSLTTSAQYLLLNSDQPNDIPQSDWNSLKDAASTQIVDSLKLKARSARNSAEIYDLLAIQWPKGLSEANRESTTKALTAIYLESLTFTCPTEELANKLLPSR